MQPSLEDSQFMAHDVKNHGGQSKRKKGPQPIPVSFKFFAFFPAASAEQGEGCADF